MQARLRVLYDGDCGFCRWSADRLRAWDRAGRLAFAPIQTSDGLLGPVPPEARLATMHAVDTRGRVFSGGAAMSRVLRELPGGGALAAAGACWPDAAEALYGAVAHRRARLGRWLGEGACRVDPSRPSAP
jgi:predicted DCC family thiol-disulfide oxidoreductase YuxK